MKHKIKNDGTLPLKKDFADRERVTAWKVGAIRSQRAARMAYLNELIIRPLKGNEPNSY